MTLVIWIVLLFAAGWLIGFLLAEKEKKSNPTSSQTKLPLPDYDNSYTGRGYQPAIPYEEYLAYLNSLSWKTKAYQRIVIDNHTCQYCGSEVRSMDGENHIPNVHHLHYRTLQVENIQTDLVTLCQSCHHDLHARYSLSEMEDVINFQRTKLTFPI